MVKRNNALIMAGYGVCLAVLLFWLFMISQTPLERHEIFTGYMVQSGHAGFDLNKTALTFGKLSPGNTASRDIILKNEYRYPVKVDFFITSELVPYINAVPQVILQPNEIRNMTFTVAIPDNAADGNYSGTVRMEMRRKWF